MLQFDEKAPIYIQIMNSIKRDIVTGKLKGGDKMPSVREMAETLKVNPNTIQRTYQELERENITFTQRGMGNFVTQDEGKILMLKNEMAREVLTAFIDGMKNLGFKDYEIKQAVEQYVEKGDR